MAESHFVEWIYQCFSVLLCMGALGGFQFFTVNKKGCCEHSRTDICVLLFLLETSRGGMAESYGTCRFNFVRNYQTVFSNDGTILHSPQQCRSLSPFMSSPTLGTISVYNFNHSNRYLLVYVIVVLILIWLKTLIILFMHLFDTPISSWWSVCSDILPVF